MQIETPHEPEIVTVARAVLQNGGVDLDNRLPDHITIQAGQELRLHLQYRFEEASRDQEEFHIRLASRLGDVACPEAKHRLRDHLWQSDAEWGFIHQTYTAPTPGEYELFVDVEACYGKHPWKSERGEETLDRAELAQTVRVTVTESSEP